ncbi:hypothetical protein HHK36_009630 [Tetracentron sinense]|uniref:Alcohol dehydrogenase-like N-terminal domain-containing protein n=1 Tax=Tetracentron sinense TaxID=13715 RepID=A0A834ZDM6_TETSI|nr:hypothetical protein HHK36_009630 [Tetracentron sinense]
MPPTSSSCYWHGSQQLMQLLNQNKNKKKRLHEFSGVATEVGCKVKKFKEGDKVEVGCIVGACHSCDNCANDLENYCPKMIFSYNAPYYDGTITNGGYSDMMVANERYVVRFPENLPLDAGAPLLCAGITVHSPMKYFGLSNPVSCSIPPKKCRLHTGRKLVADTAMGGMKETQEMIDFAGKHNITADIELIPMDYVNTAMKRLAKADVRYRFVIDIGNTLASA